MQDNKRTTRDNNGKKGLLIEKAGIMTDTTEFQNPFTNQIKEKDRLIEDLLTKLYIKEEQHYAKFAQLEKALTYMNSQSMWLVQQFGGGF